MRKGIHFQERKVYQNRLSKGIQPSRRRLSENRLPNWMDFEGQEVLQDRYEMPNELRRNYQGKLQIGQRYLRIHLKNHQGKEGLPQIIMPNWIQNERIEVLQGYLRKRIHLH